MSLDVETPTGGDSSDGRKRMEPLTAPFSITLKFVDLTYRIKLDGKRTRTTLAPPSDHEKSTAVMQGRAILCGITGMALPGEILAILGPSGSGKSTLLNALAGRLQRRGLTGSVLANGERLSRSVQKRTGFVTQDDVLYPHLTVRETLVYCALLRLPRAAAREAKVAAADAVVAELGLEKCRDTMVGGGAGVRGVSGGERRRVSIGHEVLVNPSLLVLDEPTSGLDATAAQRVVAAMAGLARSGKGGRTVVMSVHQPSSRVYQMFDKVLVLSEGRCLYFGKGGEAMGYFESIGFRPSFPVNPADFLLDLANGVCHLEGAAEREKPNVKQALVSSYDTLLAPKVKAACINAAAPKETAFVPETRSCGSRGGRPALIAGLASWLYQFSILLRRSLRERRHESFNSLRVFQVMAAAVLAGAMWWRSDSRNVQDRLGLLFFFAIFWGVFPSFNATFAFPQDRAVLRKERSAGMYSLSTYFAARIVGDLPMELLLPTAFLSVAYWMTGLRPDPAAFLRTLAVLLGYVLASQGFGLALGAAIMDAKRASTLATVTMLAFVLTGGYYVHRVPGWLGWVKYVSLTFYGYRLLVDAQYGEGEEIWGALGCAGGGGGGCRFVEEDLMGQFPAGNCVVVLLFMFVGYRLLAYMALRRVGV